MHRLLSCALVASLASTLASSLAWAHVVPPVVLHEPTAAWPASVKAERDVFVPLFVVVNEQGDVVETSVEGEALEPFASEARNTAQRFRFQPAQDERGPRRAKVRVVVHFRAPRQHGAHHDASDATEGTATAVTATGVTATEVTATEVTATEVTATGIPATEVTATEVTVPGTAPHRSASSVQLNSRVLRAAPHKSGSELLSVVPGMFVSQHSGEGKAHQIFFRGFDASHGQDVELWAAGAPVNDVSNIHGQGYSDLHFLIPEVVQEVNSTPGNYDPRQGDFSVAGTLRFKLGFEQPGTTAKTSIGNFGTRRYFMAYHPKDAGPETFGAFEIYGTDGFGPSRAARRGSAIGQAVWELGSGLSGRVMASTYAGRFDSAGVLPLADIRRGAIDRFGTYDSDQGGYSSRTQFVFELRNDGGPESQGRLSVAPFVLLRTLELRSNFTGGLTHPEGDSVQQFNDAITLGATASYARELSWFSERDEIETGIYLRHDNIRQSQHRLSSLSGQVTDDVASPGIDANLRATNAAGYVDVTLRPWANLTLRGGLRADALSYLTEERGETGDGQVRNALGAQLSKRASLDVGLLPGLGAVASYGEGFRSPQVRSLGDGETTPFTRVVSYELGLRYTEGPRLRASVAGYRTRLSDDLVLDPATARNELVPSTSRMGLTASVISEPNEWFVSSVSLTYARAAFERSDARYRAGELVPYAPQLVSRADLAVRSPVAEIAGDPVTGEVGVGTTYFGRRPLPYSEMGHDAFLMDLVGQLRWRMFVTRFEVFNVLNAEYFDGEFVYASQLGETKSLVPARHVSVGAPRAFLWSLVVSI